MNDRFRARLGVALFLVSAWGLLLRGSVAQEFGLQADVTVTVFTASPSPGPTPPRPTPSSSGEVIATPGPGATSGGDAGVGVGTGSGTGRGVEGSRPFVIAGDVAGNLEPGATADINLSLTNPNDRPIRITDLSVAIASITAPHATSALPCASADFEVGQPQVGATLIVPANSTRSLTSLGLSASQLPSLGMVNGAANQDGCKGATVRLAYGGNAVWGDV